MYYEDLRYGPGKRSVLSDKDIGRPGKFLAVSVGSNSYNRNTEEVIIHWIFCTLIFIRDNLTLKNVLGCGFKIVFDFLFNFGGMRN